jgi:hypothetical protein
MDAVAAYPHVILSGAKDPGFWNASARTMPRSFAALRMTTTGFLRYHWPAGHQVLGMTYIATRSGRAGKHAFALPLFYAAPERV